VDFKTERAAAAVGIRDGMDLLYGELETCDAAIVAPPIYCRNLSAQLKGAFDRSHAVGG
jgi:multimeric flavodoxin WrbA